MIFLGFWVFIYNVHLSECQFFGVKIEVFLILIDTVKEILLCDHPIELAFGITKELYYKKVTILTSSL